MKIRQEKLRWDVYLVFESHYGKSEDYRYVGSTYAVSRSKAISNIRYRTKIKDISEEAGDSYLEAYLA